MPPGREREGQETTGRHLITLTRIAGARCRKRTPRRFPRGVVTSPTPESTRHAHIGVDDRRHDSGRSGDSCRGAAGPPPAERPPDHGGRPEQRHGRLRSSAGQDAEPRSPGAAGRAVRSGLHAVSTVQPEPRVAADRAAPRHDRRRRPADRFPQGHSRCRDAAADVPAERLRRRARRQDLPLRQPGRHRDERPRRSQVVGSRRQSARDRQGRGDEAHELHARPGAWAARSPSTRRRRRTRSTPTARSRPRRLRCSRRTRIGRSSSARGSTGRTARSSRRRSTSTCIRSIAFPRRRSLPKRPRRRPRPPGSRRPPTGASTRRRSGRSSALTTPRSPSSTPRWAGCSRRSIGSVSPTTRSSSS